MVFPSAALLLLCLFLSSFGHCFLVAPSFQTAKLSSLTSSFRLLAVTKEEAEDDPTAAAAEDNANVDDDGKAEEDVVTGDPLRAQTGIRPSLHPTTINALVELLTKNEEFTSASLEPLQLVVKASEVATEAIYRRQKSSQKDGMTLAPEEEQTVVGRIVGVAVRRPQLEQLLIDRVLQTPWIAKYQEWSTFGVLQEECETKSSTEKNYEQLKSDPLLAMNRVECMLALFLDTVEIPRMQAANVTAPDESKIDFLDQDKKEVLLLQVK